jgi:O-antigen ligase
MIVQSLSLRPGFLHRFACVAFVIGLTALPHLESMSSKHGLVRMHLERTDAISTLANANGLAAWFGFCCVYFTIVGFETKRMAVRVTSWLAAVGCLYVVGLTVSRGPLLASAIAIIVTLRRLLKRSFLPVLVLIGLGCVIYELEIFTPIATSYAARATENTGRLNVWPLVIERFLSSPLLGVGVSNVGTYVPSKGRVITPHNNFLYLALASGVVPLIFFLGYWIRTARRVFGANIEQVSDAPFRIPLFTYAFLIALQLNTSFMFAWMVVTLCVVSSAPRRLYWVKRRDTAETREYPLTLAAAPFR